MANKDQKHPDQSSSSSLEKSFIIILIKSEFVALSIKSILRSLGGKGKILLLIFLSLPFCQPISIPGVSSFFGIAIMMIGLRIVIDGPVWMPRYISEKKISKKILHFIASKGLWLTRKIKKIIRPRLKWLCRSRFMTIVNGALIAVLGLLLALPLPVPFTNLLIAWPILLISIGLVEDDGIFILSAYLITGICLTLFIYLILKFI